MDLQTCSFISNFSDASRTYAARMHTEELSMDTAALFSRHADLNLF